MIPHFEKMLYDNAQLLLVYAQAFRLNGRPLYREAFDGIVDWLRDEMRNTSGAFYAALDADSEGVEGKFYLWTPAQVAALIDADFYPLFAFKYGLDQAPNFEGEWHLHAYFSDAEVIEKFSIEADAYARHLSQAQTVLRNHRDQRIAPGLDDKLLTSWNAMAIRGLACGAGLFGRDDYYQLARHCLDAIRNHCWHDGRLTALSQTSGKILPAYLDDYAHLLQACLDCLQFEWQPADLELAQNLAEQLLEYFADADHGGFFFTASDHEKLIQRPKSWQDEAMPSGNAVAALAIYRLGLLLGEQRYTRAAEKALQSVADNVNENAFYAAGFLALLEEIQHPPLLLIVRAAEAQLPRWREQILPRLIPGQMAFFIATDTAQLPASIAEKIDDKPVSAWICEGFSCRAPLADLGAVIAVLEEQQ